MSPIKISVREEFAGSGGKALPVTADATDAVAALPSPDREIVLRIEKLREEACRCATEHLE